jgi:SAM-dependent methyltransferase
MGYSEAELAAIPEGADLGLGCGNPQAIATMRPGEVVVDLGSGAGIDCFLAAKQVGANGRVIGVDMTHEMLARARANTKRVGAANVEFRLGEIEHLPIADNTADVGHLELRDQSCSRQGAGLPRGVSRAEARRTHRDCRCREYRAAAARPHL